MTGKIASRTSLTSLLKAGTIAGIAAAVLVTGAPLRIQSAEAAAVKLENAQQLPGFADVVSAVTPAVVSVRVQSRATPASDTDSYGFNFGGPGGFDNLPDDHPLKRFFREFGGDQFGNQTPDPGQDHWKRYGNRDKDMKPRLRPTSQGSGFFISEDGYLVTNNHVVDGGSAFTVVLADGTEMDAKMIGRDPRTDLAVLKVDEKRKFTYVQFADDSKVRVGDWVVAVGNPFGLGGTVTAGIVSARSRDLGQGPYDDFLQVDAAVNRGNSGGPTFNLEGEVVGINTAIFSPTGGNVGIAFAIPASVAKDVVTKLIKGGDIARGWLGVKIEPVTQDVADSLGLAEAAGALVNEPQTGSPGDKAGIKVGDVITAVDGETVKGPKELARKIGSMDPGKVVDVSVWRDGKSVSVKVTLGTLPVDNKEASAQPQQGTDENQSPTEQTLDKLGIIVTPADDGNGVRITSVNPQSDAADKGLKQGEKITSVNNQTVSSAEDIQKVIESAKKDGRKKALFQIEDQNGNRFVALPLG
ncbi:Do family serine endopeptidase [Rhizobium sp. KVB221]|uniref:Probable periplasmic serine endoprotease DegP-like n=1 Tax=Rhizobium setariae TaxID=2801340 RepID=A0A937CMM4_9HYPH|nr:Do family serine endopeptidase [Rhizobium setariae]MBL0371094.1 Do family serine endopeptidase [Rhizobium setariae]